MRQGSRGKRTLACALTRALHYRRKLTYVLDGDNVSHGLNCDLTFKAEDRAENIRRIGKVAKLFADAGIICIASVISPYGRDCDACRSLLPDGDFIEAGREKAKKHRKRHHQSYLEETILKRKRMRKRKIDLTDTVLNEKGPRSNSWTNSHLLLRLNMRADTRDTRKIIDTMMIRKKPRWRSLTKLDVSTKIQHPNIISLLGYRVHDETKLLVYKLMHNGSSGTPLHDLELDKTPRRHPDGT
ncbi:hypothetical protein L6452_36670 [Arctium lappa]|uniref:Uncharacterized protein n=1 Tax=Arctium lappa TaxID=4217 RepID=A0ACB8YAJ4_ARCLA|nr:hypothetical protein L6452_36670 [Arctium lappa]